MRLTTRKIVVAGMLGAVSIILGLSGLGLIPVPTPAGAVTIMHIPAILGGVLEGPVVGLLIGLIFGMSSLFRATSVLFADPIIAILPRLLIGVTAYFAYLGFREKNTSVGLIIAGLVGTVTNTVLVLGLAVLRGYLPYEAAVSVALVHGVPEAVVAAILVSLVGKAVMMYQNKNQPAEKNLNK
ncbi:MAG: ECF transporter S component [Firmicutes bacterium]|nr:ECF transporter S component [Bacillota bacterium]